MPPIYRAKFEKSSADLTQCPPADRSEFVFIGRSNVGKSSLINMICNIKGLAKTSGTPGKTQLINHFLIDEDWYAENLIEREKGHCLDKSVILISILKAFDIEARIGLAKVKNHIAAESVIKFMGTDELVPHGYVEIFLDGNWIKATPAFNKSLCDKLGVDVLEFNGEDDSIFQSFGKNGDQFMEYIEDYGTYEELPLDFIEELLLNHYPLLKQFGLKRGAILDMS